MDMQVNVAQLLKEGVGGVRTLGLDGPDLELEGGGLVYVKGNLLLTRTDRGVWVSGPVAVSVESVCARCLAPFTWWVDVRVDDVFLPRVDIVTGARVRAEDEPDADAFRIDAHHVLDLTEPLRQYRIAATPLAPLCRVDCRGICPECGTDLNDSTCACQPHQDMRWAKLRELLR